MADRSSKVIHHKIVVIGGGTAGISVAARLANSGESDVAIVEPSESHYYQPLWTLVGAGCAPQQISVRNESKLIPNGVHWIKAAATAVDPQSQTVTTTGESIGYDYLVVCPGIQLDWYEIPGAAESLGRDGVSSNYQFELAPRTWQFIKEFSGGNAVFTMPSGPIKCAGAPQKIAYLAAHIWQKKGILDRSRVILVLPTPSIFGVPEFAKVLDQVVARYGIEVRFQSELKEIDHSSAKATIAKSENGKLYSEVIPYDFMHVVPPQSAPDWIKASPLADSSNPKGYVEVDKNTLRHVRFPNVFALGDAGSTPNSKTGAAIRKQAPVVVEQLLADLHARTSPASYQGYASCPLTTARNRMLLAEFDYSGRPTPTIPFLNLQKERYDMWLIKRYGLPFIYWNAMLKGRF